MLSHCKMGADLAIAVCEQIAKGTRMAFEIPLNGTEADIHR